jgi:hypothetical protein
VSEGGKNPKRRPHAAYNAVLHVVVSTEFSDPSTVCLLSTWAAQTSPI